MTFADDPATVLPSLALLSHRVRVLPMDAASLVKMPENTVLFLDARDDLATAKTLCRLIHASGLATPIVLILTEGGFTVVNSQWGIADVVVASASPAEVEGRLRLLSERGNAPITGASTTDDSERTEDGQIRSGDLVVDTNGYTASLHGRPIDLAYKEFELLKYLVQHPGRVFTRAQLLQEVWGYDYYGGTPTADVRLPPHFGRHPYRRRAHPSPARQAGRRIRTSDRYRAQRRLPFRPARGRGRQVTRGSDGFRRH